MILARIRGGLGNQLFQYAAAKALANKHQVPLKLDLYTYGLPNTYRIFELDKFNISFEVASKKEVAAYVGKWKWLRYFNKTNNYIFAKRAFAQPHYHLVENFLNLPDDIYLSGYWQSEKYFLTIEEVIRESYTPKLGIGRENSALIERMQKEDSVSLHIRRGDYQSNTRYLNFFGTLAMEYYWNALTIIQTNISAPKFYIFSDDIPWCKEAFKDINAEYVTHNLGENSFMDMVLMSYCKHNIIANSTFSWWGAWLNKNPAKYVIAPQKWFKSNYYGGKNPTYKSREYLVKDLFPDNWILI